MNIQTNVSPSPNGTSFHGTEIVTTPQKLIDIANSHGVKYHDENGGMDKVNFDFAFQLDDGTIFTVYDWKEYRRLDLDEEIEFHIGGFDLNSTMKGKQALEQLLDGGSERVTEYIYIDYENGDEPQIAWSTRNEPDKFANNMGCIVVEGYADEVDLILDKIFGKGEY